MASQQEIYNMEAGLYDSIDGDKIQRELIADNKAEKLRISAERKAKRLGITNRDIYDDSDSSMPLYDSRGVKISNGIRLLGGDSPEIFHDIKPTGNAKNERSKVYKQVALDNGLTLEEAVKLVDNQAEAYKIDQAYRNSDQFKIDQKNNPNDMYYNSNNLSDAVANLRQKHITGKDYNIQSYDIYNAGDKAVDASMIDSQLHPISKLENSRNYLTGDLGAFGRELADNKNYVNRQIASGYMDPGSNDRNEYEKQLKLQANAKAKGLGNYGSNNVDPKVMDLIHETSFAKWKYDNPDFVKNDSIGVNDIKDGILNIGTTVASLAPDLADVGMEALIGLNHWVGDPAGLEKMDNVQLSKFGMKKAKDGTVQSVIFDNGKEALDKMVGLNEKKLTSGQKQITDRIYKIYEDDKLDKIEKTKRIIQVMRDNVGILPQLMGGMYGFIVTMGFGAGVKLAAVANTSKLAKIADVLGIADKATTAERVAKATKVAKSNPKLAAKLDETIAGLEKRFAGDKVAVTAAGVPFAATTTDQILQARHDNNIANDGTDNYSTPFEVLATAATSYGINSIDLMTDKFALSPHASKLIQGTAKMFTKNVAEASTKETAFKALKSALAFVASASGKMAESTVVEGSTEGIQQAIQIYAEKYGTDKFKDKELSQYYDNEAVKSIIGSTAIGSFMGATAKGGGIAYGQAIDAGKKVQDSTDKKKENTSGSDEQVNVTSKDLNEMNGDDLSLFINNQKSILDNELDNIHNEKFNSAGNERLTQEARDLYQGIKEKSDRIEKLRIDGVADDVLDQHADEIDSALDTYLKMKEVLQDTMEKPTQELRDSNGELSKEEQEQELANKVVAYMKGSRPNDIKQDSDMTPDEFNRMANDIGDQSATLTVDELNAIFAGVDGGYKSGSNSNNTDKKSENSTKTKTSGSKKSDKAEEDITQDTSSTDTHTIGISANTIKKLARIYGLNKADLQTSINTAIGGIQIQKMKGVSKEANTVQHEIYHGDNGVVTKFAEYRKALATNDKETAIKAINSIKRRGYTQEVKYNKMIAKYDELMSHMQSILGTTDAAVAKANKTLEAIGKEPLSTDQYKANEIKKLNKIEFRAANSNTKIKALDVLKDIDGNDGVKSILKVSDGKSNIGQLLGSIEESINNINDVVRSMGHTKDTVTGTIISGKEDIAKANKAIEDANKIIANVDAALESKDEDLDTELLNEIKAQQEEIVSNNEEKIARLTKNGKYTSTTRFIADTNEEEIADLTKSIAELVKKDKLTKAEETELKAKQKDLEELTTDNTVDIVKANLGKKVGHEIDNKPEKTDKLNRFSITSVVPESVKESTKKTKEKVDESFTSKLDSEDAKSAVAEIEKAKKEIDTTSNESGKENIESNKERDKLISKFMTMVGGEKDYKSYRYANSAIEKSKEAIEEARAKIKELKKKQVSISKGVERSLNKKAKEIEGVSSKDIEKVLGIYANELKESGDIGKSKEDIKKITDSLDIKNITDTLDNMNVFSIRVKDILKGLRNIVYRYVQSSTDSELGREISKLEKSIDYNKRKITDKEAMLRSIEDTAEEYGSVATKSIQATFDNIKKIENVIKTRNSSSRATIEKLRAKIDTLRAKLVGTTNMSEWIANGPAYDSKGKLFDISSIDQGDGTENQVADLNSIIDWQDTLLGGIGIDSAINLLSDSEKVKFNKELVKTEESIKKILKLDKIKLKDGTEVNSVSKFQLASSPMIQLLFGKIDSNGNYNINKNMVAAITIANSNWLGATGSTNLYNDREMAASMLGYHSEFEVSKKEWDMLKRKGSFRKVVGNGLGKDIARLIGFKAGENMSESMEAKLISNLGLISLAAMQGNGDILDMTTKESQISNEDWNNTVGKASNLLDSKSSKKDSKDKDKTLDSKVYVGMILTKEVNIKSRYEPLGEMANSVTKAFDIEEFAKDYLTYKPKENNNRKVKGSIWDVAKKAVGILNEVEANEYKLIEDSTVVLNELYKDRDTYIKANGWKDIDAMKKANTGMLIKDYKSKDDIDSQESKNKEVEKSYDNLMALDDKVKGGMINKLWFRWSFIKNGRFQLESIGINPQSDKLLHRWLVAISNNDRVWDTRNDKDFYYFKQGLAQALGVGIDKENKKTIIKIADKVLSMKDDEITEMYKELASTGKYELDGEKLEAEHPGHMVQSLIAVRKYKAAKEASKTKDFTFKAIMVSEYDSVTSGFAHKILQMPILAWKDVTKWAAKTGIFIDDEHGKDMGMNDYIDEGSNPDAYKTMVFGIDELATGDELTSPKKVNSDGEEEPLELGKDKISAKDAMEAMINTWTPFDKKDKSDQAVQELVKDGKVTSWARNLFKYPFMIFGYAGNINTIKRRISDDLTKDIMDGLLVGKYKYDNKNIFLKAIGVKSAEDLIKLRTEMTEKSNDDIYINNVNVKKTISDMFNGTYGLQFEKMMNGTFLPFVEANKTIINATKIMFKGFIQELEVRTKAKEEEVGRSLTHDEVNEIIKGKKLEDGTYDGEGLEKLFPLIKAPLSETAHDRIAIADDGLTDYKSRKLDKATVSLAEGNIKTISIQAMIREYKMAEASGAVLPIHWIDGTTVGGVIKDGDILGIHDAIVLGKDFAKNIAKMNKSTYDTNKNYNLIGNILDSLVNNLKASGSDRGVINEGTATETDAKEVLTELIALAEKVNEARKKLYNSKMTIRNIADVEESGYKANAVKVTDKQYNDILKNNKLVKEMVPKKDIEKAIQDSIEEGCSK